MKFLYIGDFHLCETPPTSRIDDYHQTLINKIQEIRQIAVSNNCTAILEGGDLFNTPHISEEMLASYFKAFSENNMSFEDIYNGTYDDDEIVNNYKTSCPLIGVVGNHELFGETMTSFDKTSLHFCEKVGLIRLVTKDNPIILQDKDGTKIAITGTNYSHDIDGENKSGYIIDNKIADRQIHIVHGMMIDKPNKLYKAYTLPSDVIEKTKADITFTGHYHDGFKTVKKDGKYIINSGAVVRQSMRKTNMTRKPKVVLVDITKDNISIKSIYLKSAKPAKDVFNLEEKEKKIKFTEKLEEIKAKVEEANLNEKGSNITEIVTNIATNENLNEKLKEELVLALSDKMKDMKVEKKALPQYTIKKLILENFQSHEYSEFEFSEGLNVFTGESGSGKTSVIRALNWIYENSAKNARRYIRTDKDYCKATVVLSNGYEISRVVERKTNGFNGYEILYPENNERVRTNTKELPVIQDLLGFSKLIVDNSKTSKDIPVNFLKQGSPWFFVGDGNTAPERAKIIGCIYGTQYTDSLAKDIEQGIKKNSTLVKEQEKTCNEFDLSLRTVDFVDDMKADLEEFDELSQKTRQLLETKAKIQKLKEELEFQEAKEKALNNFIESTNNFIENAQTLLENTNNIFEKRMKLQTSVQKYQQEYKKMKIYNDFIKELQGIDIENKKVVIENTLKLIEQRKDIENKIDKIQEGSKLLAFYKAKGAALTKFLNDTKDINSHLEMIEHTMTLANRRDKVFNDANLAINEKKRANCLVKFVNDSAKLISVLTDCSKNIEEKLVVRDKGQELKNMGHVEQGKLKEINSTIQTYNQQIQEKKNEYAELLKVSGHCPVCASKIEIENIPNIIKENFGE